MAKPPPSVLMYLAQGVFGFGVGGAVLWAAVTTYVHTGGLAMADFLDYLESGLIVFPVFGALWGLRRWSRRAGY